MAQQSPIHKSMAKNLGFDRIDGTDCGRAIFKAGYMDSSSLTEETMYDEKWMFESLDERIKYGIETRFFGRISRSLLRPKHQKAARRRSRARGVSQLEAALLSLRRCQFTSTSTTAAGDRGGARPYSARGRSSYGGRQ